MTLTAGLCSAVTLVSALVSLVFSIVALRAATPGARVASEYALARSVALSLIAAIAPITGAMGFIAAAAGAMICVQSLDALIGARMKDRIKTYGPLATATLNTATLIWLISTL